MTDSTDNARGPERITAEKLDDLWEEFEASARPISFDGDIEFFNVEDMEDQAYYLYEAAKSLLDRADLAAPSPDVLALVEAVKASRQVAALAMATLMQQGREGLLLADKLHKVDDKVRAALARITDTGGRKDD